MHRLAMSLQEIQRNIMQKALKDAEYIIQQNWPILAQQIYINHGYEANPQFLDMVQKIGLELFYTELSNTRSSLASDDPKFRAENIKAIVQRYAYTPTIMNYNALEIEFRTAQKALATEAADRLLRETLKGYYDSFMAGSPYLCIGSDGKQYEIWKDGKIIRPDLSQWDKLKISKESAQDYERKKEGQIRDYEYPLADAIAAVVKWLRADAEAVNKAWGCGTLHAQRVNDK